MKNFWKQYKKIFAYVLSAMVCACFFVYVLALVGEHTSETNVHAQERAEFYTREQAQSVQARIDGLKREAEYIAAKVAVCTNRENFVQEMRGASAIVSENKMFLNAYYLKDGRLYSAGGTPIDGYPELNALAAANGSSLSRMFQFENRVMSVGASADINSEFADKIVAVFDKLSLAVFSGENEENGESGESTETPIVVSGSERAEFTLICKHDGKIVDRLENGKDFAIGSEAVQNGVFQTIFYDEEKLGEVTAALLESGVHCFPFSRGADSYVLSIRSFGAENGGLSLVSVYRVDKIYGNGFTLVQSISAALLGLAVVLFALLLSLVIGGVRSRKKIFRLEMVVADLNCPTLKKFEKNAEGILKRYAVSNFAFVSMQIHNFGYVSEQFGETSLTTLAKYAADAVRHALYYEETFGYCGNGEFILLLHYRGRQALTERLNGLNLRLAAFDGLGESFKAGASFAVYEAERNENQNIKQMTEKLNMAKESSPKLQAPFGIAFYEDAMRKNYMMKAEIEGKMEQALKNSEFHLFYQPKYNLKTKNLDGCEILVRWYDAELEKYHVPAEFLPVFEENGFIAQIDRFVFFKACENLAARAASRKICYPISVNVSRVTAIQSDFIDYYVRIKKKFEIKDRFITLEFTESFAYENYEYLKETVDKLHQNGFLCSIDDFGTGYSSYNILKTIEADEIKLDKFFLAKGFSAERDRTLLESVIEMVKKLGMKATQEGVERQEDMYRLENLGCDVIQGYYFAKPMKHSDYCDFIDCNFA